MMSITRTEILGAILLSLLAYFLWQHFAPPPAPVGQWVEATSSKELKVVPKVSIQPKALKVYAPSAKQKLNLPAALQQDDNSYVIASSTLAHDYHPQTVSSVINSETGEVTTITRREDYPWFAPEQTGEARVDYGIKNGGVRVGRLTVREDVLQIKAVHLGATATLDSDRDYFVGVGLGVRW
jgi:hypothetical protein